MKKIITFIIKIYQKTLSPDHGLFFWGNNRCRFYPTCSVYAQDAINKFGIIKGTYLAIHRVTRCNPWNEGGVDPINK